MTGSSGSTVAAAASGAKAGQEVVTGIAMMVVAMLVLPGIDAIAKYLSDSVPPGQVSWSRFLFQVIYLLPLVLLVRRGPLYGPLWLHGLRGALIAAATLFFFWSLEKLPLADAIAIFFVEPLILTLMSAVFLGETVGWRRLTAVAVGFLGALIVIRPSYAVFGWQALLPVCAATCFATYLILTRKLAPRCDAVLMQFSVGVSGALVLSLALWAGALTGTPVLSPVWPSRDEWLLMALLGAIATSGHMLVVHAFRRVAPSILASFQYLEIIGATVLGLLLFGDFPEPLTWLGVAIIVGSGLYVFHRERRLARSGQ